MRREASSATGPSRQVNLGERLRDIRLRAGVSVRTLASKAEFSPSFISQVELGQASPSVASLERIAAALDVTLGELFSEVEPRGAVVVRADDRQRLASSWSRAEIEPLGPLGGGSRLQPVMIAIAPGGRSGRYAHGLPGEEFAIVFEGEVTLTLGEETHVLRRGDAVTFRSEVSRHWENTGLEPVRLVTVTTRA
jgi:XRE family transcriptional regulator, regulator of sulfur utilization